MLQSGLNVRPVITHRLAWGYLEGFETMARGECGKIVLDGARTSSTAPRRLRAIRSFLSSTVQATRFAPMSALQIEVAKPPPSCLAEPPPSCLAKTAAKFVWPNRP